MKYIFIKYIYIINVQGPTSNYDKIEEGSGVFNFSIGGLYEKNIINAIEKKVEKEQEYFVLGSVKLVQMTPLN